MTPSEWFASIGKTPRPYQLACIEQAEQLMSSGARVCIVAPTGAGKSVISACLMRHGAPPENAFLVHTRTLRDQSKVTVPNVTVGTLQGLIAQGSAGDARRERFRSMARVGIDETHHVVSSEFGQIIPWLAGKAAFGVTATPERSDGTPLGDCWQELVVAAKYSELVRDGYLCPCDIAKPEMDRKTQKRKKVKPDGVAAYMRHAQRPDGSYRPGIHFERTKAECYDCAERYQQAGIRARVITDETPTDERQGVFTAYTRGELDMLLSPQALAEGFDSPRAEVCVLNRSAAHVGGYLQMCGRVLRPFSGDPERGLPAKERALLIDCSDASSVHGAPTADRRYSLDGAGIELEQADEDKERAKKEAGEQARMIEVKFSIVRDKLRDMYTDLVSTAKEREYKLGWVFHQFTAKTGIQPPRAFEAKYRSVCKQCRHRLNIGEPMLWAGSGLVYHHDCWFESIQQEQLLTADEMQPRAQRLLQEIRDGQG